MRGKVCLVTGANTGIGKATAHELARRGAAVALVCRRESDGLAVADEIRIDAPDAQLGVFECDLASLANVRNLADRVTHSYDRLDVLINNAGVVTQKRTLTEDGYEMQFAVNHLAPFLLTHLLLDRLKASAPSRVIVVTSAVYRHGTIRFRDIHRTMFYNAFSAYRQSKLANVLFTLELARRLNGSGVTANCLHPGMVRTGIMRNMNFAVRGVANAVIPMISVEEGARTPVYLATSPEVEGVSGKYFEKEAEAPPSRAARNPDLALRLWRLSAELTGVDAGQKTVEPMSCSRDTS